MRTFFRWIWRFNGLVLATLGVIGLVSVVGYFTFFGSSDFGSWNPDERANVVQSANDAPEIRLIEGAATESHLLAVLVRGQAQRDNINDMLNMGVTRNFILFEREGGGGRSVFPANDGQIGRYFTVDASCRPIRQHQGPGFNVIALSGSPNYSLPAAAEAAAIVALYGAPESSTWSLGVVDIRTGAWREAAAGVDRLEDLMSSRGRCLAAVRREGALHAVEFGLGEEIAARAQELTLP